MVYEHGMRVKGVSPVAGTSEIKIPALERAAHALDQFSEVVAPPKQKIESSLPSALHH